MPLILGATTSIFPTLIRRFKIESFELFQEEKDEKKDLQIPPREAFEARQALSRFARTAISAVCADSFLGSGVMAAPLRHFSQWFSTEGCSTWDVTM